MALLANPLVLPINGSEVVYVSPPYTPSDGSQATRSRRTNRSSSDSSSRAWDGFIDEDLRAGGPFLPELPCETIYFRPDHPFRQSRGVSGISELTRPIWELCKREQINVCEIWFCDRRHTYEENASATFTCMIVAKKQHLKEKWPDIARTVRRTLLEQGVDGVAVEIVDPRLSESMRLESCTPGDAIFGKWNDVRGDIEQTIHLRGINIISCFRVGSSADSTHCAPTVVLGVDHKEQRDWRVTREDVLKILTKHGLKMVGVLIRKDSAKLHTERYSGPAIDNLPGDGIVHVGQSLSPNRMRSARGTLGGYIELRNPTRGDWVPFALTCCHCVLPTGKHISDAEKELFQKWERSGVRITDTDAPALLLVDSPSQSEILSKLQTLKTQMEDHAEDETYRRVQIAKDQGEFVTPPDETYWKVMDKSIMVLRNQRESWGGFYHKNAYVFGMVLATSGLVEKPLATIREKDKNAGVSVVDWAIVKIIQRGVGTNKSSDLHLPFGKLETFSTQTSIHPGKILKKLGHATGYTVGTYNGLLEAHVAINYATGQSKITYEHSILSSTPGSPFSARGDYGSLVYDEFGFVHGVLFGGNENEDMGYFTHISDVLTDMKSAVPGLEEIRVLGEDSS
ncbi:hypothetical protein BO78DRAFT_424819 [Aspergillus sclerotiicarbonarius CBS 121057]|uniref:Uncharacterized protein n=1 Tax=Aspergillus sclerotiicarbonarius (strain CBS 121057 / IBT 28362) TaxID=1448318 RepID=A0A319EVF4_ASPSB|nr:hypothetical protein BO78DRAFT_424819 [Aspergillus sclerotiicarbonarius CBS 121057]